MGHGPTPKGGPPGKGQLGSTVSPLWVPWEPWAPMAPPLTLGFVLVSFTGKFTDILGIDLASKLTTLFLDRKSVV